MVVDSEWRGHMRIYKKTYMFRLLLAAQLLVFAACKQSKVIEVIIGEQVIQVTDEASKEKLLNQLAKWESGKKQENEDSCLFQVQTKAPNHHICIVDSSTLYQDGYLVEKVNTKQWLNLLLDEQTRDNSLLGLFITHNSVVIRADDANVTKDLDLAQKTLLLNELFQAQVLEANQSIGYGFPTYPAFQILFDEELIYLAPSYSGLTSLFHNGKEYLIQIAQLRPLFGSLELPAISEQSLSYLFGSETAQFLEFQRTDYRVDPIVRFLIQDSEEAQAVDLKKLSGKLIFIKQGKEEIILVHEQGFEYKGKKYQFPNFPEALQSAFTAE